MGVIIDFPNTPESFLDLVKQLATLTEPGIVTSCCIVIGDANGRTRTAFFNADAGQIAFAALHLQTEAIVAGELLERAFDEHKE